MILINDLIGFDGAKGYDHGCADYAIARYLGDGLAEVAEVGNCHNCWQVGHGNDHVYAVVGEVIRVDLHEIEKANNVGWRQSANVRWETTQYPQTVGIVQEE